ncbi:tetratricopeptide repeat protein [Synechococcus elongatus]|uniref:tetratricopeptide repeat protein n=1 Tax=Synechococcus elongatus TaxID=32046 RepID=UPI000F7D785C|nr:tetratricopeptide repeat protein [Synechococcus elongatus]
MSLACDSFDEFSLEHLQQLATEAATTGDLTTALQLIELAAWQEPDNPQILCRWGDWLAAAGQPEEAIAAYQAALESQPDYPPAIAAWAAVLNEQGQFAEAIALLDQASEQTADLWHHRAVALQSLGDWPQALTSCDSALQLDPTAAESQFLRSKLRLGLGDWSQGWPEYESRLLVFSELRDRLPSFGCPLWQGEELTNKTLLIWGEQGYGDQIQFVRYLAVLHDRWPETPLLLLVSEPLVDLFRQLAIANLQVATQFTFETEPAYDFHLPLLSLPERLGATADVIPLAQGYLPRSLQSEIRLQANPRQLQVGFVWQAGETNDRRYQWRQASKSVPLEQFLQLRLQVNHCQFWSLQVGSARQSLLQNWDWADCDLADRMHSFADTAAVLNQMDLLITVDTAIAHLAGALEIPTWLLLPKVADWRWSLTGSETPWYQSMRLYRQAIVGDWRSVFEQLQQDLNSRPY